MQTKTLEECGDQSRRPVFRQIYASQYYTNLGIVLHLLGQREKAISNFRTALCLDWRHEKAAFWLGKAERAGRDIPQARKSGAE